MNRGVFITGTDTGCGKTHVSVALIRALHRRGLRVAGFKPVAAGATVSDGEMQNDDALALQRAGNVNLSYAEVNPYCFADPVSPHLAAGDAGVQIDVETIKTGLQRIAARSDLVVVEGAGGWHVPLGPDLDIADLALSLDLPVVLVVGLRLGCLNHAQLSVQAIRASGARLLGWIGSQTDPEMVRVDENLDTLAERLGVPCLGVLRHGQSGRPDGLKTALNLDALCADSAICG